MRPCSLALLSHRYLWGILGDKRSNALRDVPMKTERPDGPVRSSLSIVARNEAPSRDGGDASHRIGRG
jgi:hypothetical protein